MKFGQLVRRLRKEKGLTLRELAPQVGVGFTYLSRVETGRLHSGDYPSEALIHRLAEVLDTDEDNLLVLAEKIPTRVRRRVLERPDEFRLLANLPDRELRRLVKSIRAQRTR